MQRRVRSVRVPAELDDLDLTGVIAECAKYLRDLESATLLKAQGNKEAARQFHAVQAAYEVLRRAEEGKSWKGD